MKACVGGVFFLLLLFLAIRRTFRANIGLDIIELLNLEAQEKQPLLFKRETQSKVQPLFG